MEKLLVIFVLILVGIALILYGAQEVGLLSNPRVEIAEWNAREAQANADEQLHKSQAPFYEGKGKAEVIHAFTLMLPVFSASMYPWLITLFGFLGLIFGALAFYFITTRPVR